MHTGADDRREGDWVANGGGREEKELVLSGCLWCFCCWLMAMTVMSLLYDITCYVLLISLSLLLRSLYSIDPILYHIFVRIFIYQHSY